MKHASVFTALAVAVSIGMLSAGAFAQGGDTSSPKTENDTLKKQVETLKAQLGMATKQIDDLKTKLKTATKSDSQATPTTDEGFHVRLHENNDKWWTNPRLMMFEVALRRFVGTQYPDQSTSAWLGRQKYFLGRELTWKMNIRSIRDISGIAARTEYRRSQKNMEGMKQRIEQSRQSIAEAEKSDNPERATRSKEQMQNALASLQKEQAFLALWEQLDKARGGAIVQLSLNSSRGRGRETMGQLTVHLALTGDAAVDAADFDKRGEVTVSGKIVRAWIERDRNVSVALKGKITQDKKQRTEKNTDRRRTRADRRGRPERMERGMERRREGER